MVWLPDGKKIQTYERFDMIHDREKNRRFHVPQPTFLFHMETPLRLSRNMLHGWKDNSMFPSYTMQCQKIIAIFTTFLFHLETPLCHHAKCCMDGKRIRCLLSSIVPELYEAMQKNRVSSGDAHGNHAKCCMDGK